MKSLIKKLDWDSAFFDIKIGEITLNEDLSIDALLDFDLVVVKQLNDFKVSINSFTEAFQETKVTFSKKITHQTTNDKSLIFDADECPINEKDLFELAYESGKYSRFLLDTHFKKDDFKKLYEKWVINSLNKKFADKVFYLKTNDSILGFITIKKNDMTTATIGLIAVAENRQGMGFGSDLLKKAEEYCYNEKIIELRIPTQKENLLACKFYNKMGYDVLENLIIKHFWKVK